MYKTYFLYAFIIGVFLSACSEKQGPAQETDLQKSETEIKVPAFNEDSAYAFIAKQVAFGPRVPNTIAHRQCGDFLIEKLASYGAEVTVQTFDATAYNGKSLHLQNIIGSYNLEASKRILLASHWDTRPIADKDTANTDLPIDGANDGASGVGVLLEIARQIHTQNPPSIGVDIIFFDGEDYGEPEGYEAEASEDRNQVWWCLGSQYWAQHKHQNNYMAYYGILLDMVGGPQARFYREEVSRRNAGIVVEKIWDQAQALGYEEYFIQKDSPEILDDHVYLNYTARIPTIDIVEYDPAHEGYFASYHHTHADNMDIIRKPTLKAVGQTVLHAVYYE